MEVLGGGGGNLAATQVRLTAEELTALDAVSRLPAEYPGWMIELQGEFRRKQLHVACRPAGPEADGPRSHCQAAWKPCHGKSPPSLPSITHPVADS